MKDESTFGGWNRGGGGGGVGGNGHGGQSSAYPYGNDYGVSSYAQPSASMFPYANPADQRSNTWSSQTNGSIDLFQSGYGGGGGGGQQQSQFAGGSVFGGSAAQQNNSFAYNNFATNNTNFLPNSNTQGGNASALWDSSPKNARPTGASDYAQSYRDVYAVDGVRQAESAMSGLSLNARHNEHNTYMSSKTVGNSHSGYEQRRSETTQKKTTWASVASQPAKITPKSSSLKSKMASSALSSASSKHMLPSIPPPINDPIGTWDSKSSSSGSSAARKTPPATAALHQQQPPPTSQQPKLQPPSNQVYKPPIPQADHSQSANASYGHSAASGGGVGGNHVRNSNPRVVNRNTNAPPPQRGPSPPPPRILSHNALPSGADNGAVSRQYSRDGPDHRRSAYAHQPDRSSNGRSGQQRNAPPPPSAAATARPTDAAPIPKPTTEKLNLDVQQYNPRDFDCSAVNARFFIIKSYSEDDIHRSIKYAIWCSTEHGNKRLDQAYRSQEGKGPVYLFYSVNGSGHFCGKFH